MIIISITVLLIFAISIKAIKHFDKRMDLIEQQIEELRQIK